jgi:NADH dehydrogenase
VREVSRNYQGIDPGELRVVLVHSQSRILPEVSEKLALFAQNILMNRGVEVRLNTRLEAATGEEAILQGGEKIPTRTLVSTVPSSPHPIIDGLDLPKGKNGRLITDRYLQVNGTDNIWALGDCAQVPAHGEGFAPPTAQHAIRQARSAATNIVAAIRGGQRSEFSFEGLGMMGALGHHSAVAEIMGVNISGFAAWWIRRTIYLMKLPGWGRRLKVASSWTLDLLLPAELVELKLTGSMGMTQEHFEPGEEVFHQGDIGDRIYIIVSGEAEVVHEAGDEQRVLARLGAGEYFGEMALLKQSTRGATVRCCAPMNTLSLPKREFSMLAAYVPQLRETLENVMQQRTKSNAEKIAND